jgi:hypothetical protein
VKAQQLLALLLELLALLLELLATPTQTNSSSRHGRQ